MGFFPNIFCIPSAYFFFFLVLILAFNFFLLFLTSPTQDSFSFCVCDDELPSRSVHLPLGASHISMQHPLAAGPWSGSGIGPGGSGTPFLLDGGKVTLWQLAAKETPKFYCSKPSFRSSFVFSFSQMIGTHTYNHGIVSPLWERQPGRLLKGKKAS